jgi:3-methyladenine DNA glycosylase/8-oxoguanine DNA glycosylase
MSNDEVIKALTDIAGIGVWTANVFLICNLQRLDVVPAADLGIRPGVQLAMGSRASPRPSWFTKRLCVGSSTEVLLVFTYGMQLSSR